MRVHQSAQLITNLRKHVIWISLRHFLHPLYLSVELLALRGSRVDDLFVLLLQIINDVFGLPCYAFKFLVELTALPDRRDCGIGSSKKGQRVNLDPLVLLAV